MTTIVADNSFVKCPFIMLSIKQQTIYEVRGLQQLTPWNVSPIQLSGVNFHSLLHFTQSTKTNPPRRQTNNKKKKTTNTNKYKKLLNKSYLGKIYLSYICLNPARTLLPQVTCKRKCWVKESFYTVSKVFCQKGEGLPLKFNF